MLYSSSKYETQKYDLIFSEDDFEIFDFLIALDRSHLKILEDQAPENCSAVLRLLLDYDPKSTIEDVPDPYYGDLRGFDGVLNLIERASAGLLKELHKISTRF